MKPLGLTFDLQVARPTKAMDAIWDAVEVAIAENMTPEQFRHEAADAWEQRLHDDAKHARDVLRNHGR
jgi:hypothetical protein